MSWEQVVGIAMLLMAVPLGILLRIDAYGGWSMLWCDIKKCFSSRKER